MNLVSLLLSVRPERADAVCGALNAIPGVRIHPSDEPAKLVVTVEDAPDRPLMPSLLAVQSVEHVLCTTLTFEYCDDPVSVE
jgi:nitrate reductase NapAB chaperone NapD